MEYPESGKTSSIWKKIQENRELLDSCEGIHNFVYDNPGKVVPRYSTCTKCGGELDPLSVNWYIKGVEHGSK